MTRVDFPIATFGKETPERILRAAMKWDAGELFVIGLSKSGEILVSGTTSDAAEINFYLDAAKIKVMRSVIS